MTTQEQNFNKWFDEYADGVKVFEETDMKMAYLQGAEELEKAKKLLEKWLFFCGHSEENKSPLQEETEKFLGKTISQIEIPEGVEEIK